MKKRLFSILLSLCLILTLLPVTAWAATTSGTCGENIFWSLDDNGTFTLSGTGDHFYSGDVPWESMRDKIKTVIVKDGITGLGDPCTEGLFRECKNLTSVTIPNSVTFISDYTFFDCTSLSSITIPNSVTEIHNCVFSGCSSLTSITIPDSVTSMGYEVFSHCSNLKNVTLSNSIEWIGSQAFSDCTSLSSITIPSSVIVINPYTFSNCMNLTNVTIPDSIRYIYEGAFSDCKSLTSILILASVQGIESGAFASCDKLREINVDANNSRYISTDGVLFQLSQTRVSMLTISGAGLLQYPAGKPDTDYIIPRIAAASGTSTNQKVFRTNFIASQAFEGCSTLRSVKIPSSVTDIRNCAFANCSGLISIIIPEGVENIWSSAFSECSNLKEITLPTSLKYIQSEAFLKSSVKDVYYAGTKAQWEAISINEFGNDPLLKANIHYEETTPELVIDAPEALKDAVSIDVSTGAVAMAIPRTIPNTQAPIQNVLCAFSDSRDASGPASEYKSGSIAEQGQTVQITPKNKNYQTVKIFTLDEDYRPVCKPTIVQIPASD